ncbi:hypothetical protein Vretifemale_12747, partial [Volvox reticuliferus]
MEASNARTVRLLACYKALEEFVSAMQKWQVGVHKWQLKVYKQQVAMSQQNHAMLSSIMGGVDHPPPVKLPPLLPLSYKIDSPTTTTRIFKTAIPVAAGLPLLTIPAAPATAALITLDDNAAATVDTPNTIETQRFMAASDLTVSILMDINSSITNKHDVLPNTSYGTRYTSADGSTSHQVEHSDFSMPQLRSYHHHQHEPPLRTTTASDHHRMNHRNHPKQSPLAVAPGRMITSSLPPSTAKSAQQPRSQSDAGGTAAQTPAVVFAAVPGTTAAEDCRRQDCLGSGQTQPPSQQEQTGAALETDPSSLNCSDHHQSSAALGADALVASSSRKTFASLGTLAGHASQLEALDLATSPLQAAAAAALAAAAAADADTSNL